jgi:ubiquinol-cytochrome c reductase cytochrome c1 subunit
MLGGVFGAPIANAAGDTATPPAQDWSFNGPFGTYDRGALQRGFQVYKQVCSACHGMRLKSYRNLTDLGYSDDEVKAIAAEYTVMDGPDGEGEMFERVARPSDRFVEPYANAETARYANNGALPPDMSLLTKARAGGADYVYGVLMGYEQEHHDEKHPIELGAGQHYNKYMPGNKIAMAAPLSDDMVAYEDGSPTTAEQYSKDVSQFLTWAAEPEMEERKRMGIKVLLFLMAFAGVMYSVKKKIWANVKH